MHIRAPSTSKRKCTISKVHLFCARSHLLRLVFCVVPFACCRFLSQWTAASSLTSSPHTSTYIYVSWCLRVLSNTKFSPTLPESGLFRFFSCSSMFCSSLARPLSMAFASNGTANACVRFVCNAYGGVLSREQFCGVPGHTHTHRCIQMDVV